MLRIASSLYGYFFIVSNGIKHIHIYIIRVLSKWTGTEPY